MNGLNLQYMSVYAHENPDIVLQAIGQNPDAYQYAGEFLKSQDLFNEAATALKRQHEAARRRSGPRHEQEAAVVV
jgi:hypothetical protein